MNTKTMEGLVGASTNMNLLNTPFRVYKEARRRGDTATMERAMEYVNEFSDKADKYKEEVSKGMKEDAKSEREKAELEREKAVQKRKEECRELEERIEESKEKNRNMETDTVKISEEGKALLKENIVAKTGTEAVIYTKTGEVGNSLNIRSYFDGH